MTDHDDLEQVRELVEFCSPAFAGRPVQVQGAALADLLATWLAGHVIVGDGAATARLHAEILHQHLETVLALIPITYRALIEPQMRDARQ